MNVGYNTDLETLTVSVFTDYKVCGSRTSGILFDQSDIKYVHRKWVKNNAVVSFQTMKETSV